MVPRTFPSTYQTANGETRMVVFFLSSVSGLRKWVDYIPVKFTMLETQVNNSYNNNGVILVDPLSSTTNRQAWVDYVPVFVDANDTAAWRVDANGFIPVGFSTKPTLNLDFAGTKTLDSRVTFTRASNATYFDANGVLQTASNNVARFDHNPTTLQSLGLLIEEQRTNSIRNNTMQGAVAGTPGTLPTNWSVFAANGLTTTVVAIGTSNGVSYIDLKFSGTSTNTFYVLALDSSPVAASAGQSWTESFWVSLISGSLANVNSCNFNIRWSSGNADTPFTPTATFTRVSATGVAPAGITTVVPAFLIIMQNNAAIDFTLRIGLPQLELGAFATSAIPTTVAAATRNADVATMTGTNFSSWYNATEGTLYTDYSVPFLAPAASQTSGYISDGTSNNRIVIRTSSPSNNNAGVVATGGTVQAVLTSTLATVNISQKIAFAYKANDFAYSDKAATVQTDTSGTVPVVNQMGIGNALSSEFINGYIRRIAYWGVRLDNSKLQALTT